MRDTTHLDVVVGVGGDRGRSAGALEWAADEAARRRTDLVVAHAIDLAARLRGAAGGEATVAASSLRERAAAVLDAAVRKVRDTSSGLGVVGVLREDGAVHLLEELAERAQLLVVGRAPIDPVELPQRQLLRDDLGELRSVHHRLAAHATCPVVVVPDQDEPVPSGPVTVGLSTTRSGLEALRFAMAEAAVRGTALRVVRSWGDDPGDPHAFNGAAGEDWRRTGHAAVEYGLSTVQPFFPEVDVQVSLSPLARVDALILAGRDSTLLVLGRRHGDRPARSRLGPVSGVVLQRASCPVVLVGRLFEGGVPAQVRTVVPGVVQPGRP